MNELGADELEAVEWFRYRVIAMLRVMRCSDISGQDSWVIGEAIRMVEGIKP